jgi:hypothetical protein
MADGHVASVIAGDLGEDGIDDDEGAGGSLEIVEDGLLLGGKDDAGGGSAGTDESESEQQEGDLSAAEEIYYGHDNSHKRQACQNAERNSPTCLIASCK